MKPRFGAGAAFRTRNSASCWSGHDGERGLDESSSSWVPAGEGLCVGGRIIAVSMSGVSSSSSGSSFRWATGPDRVDWSYNDDMALWGTGIGEV